jgi:hypothetical protein
MERPTPQPQAAPEKEAEPAPEPAPAPRRKEEPIVTAQPQKRDDLNVRMPSQQAEAPAQQEDDEAWGAIPSFLRRHKK